MFRRRKPRSYPQMAQDMVYPRGGWGRAGRYLLHRLRRLPDAPHRIGRGLAAGVFVSFSPFIGAHVVLAMAVAWAIGGTIFASIIGTLIGNPLTLPFIAVACTGLGRWLLGVEGHVGPQTIIGEITRAAGEVASNVLSMADDGEARWTHLAGVWEGILLPYLVGGLLLGLLAGVVTHYASVPLIRTYQRRKAARPQKRAR